MKKRNKEREASIKIFGSQILRLDKASVGEPFNSHLLPSGAIHWSKVFDNIGKNVTVYGLVASNYIDKYAFDDFVDRDILETGPNDHFVSIAVGRTYPDDDVIKEVIWGKKRRKWPKPGNLPWSHEKLQPYDDYYDDDFERPICGDTLVVITGVPFRYNGVYKIRVSDPYSIMVFDPIKNKFVYPGVADYENWFSCKDDYLTDDDDDDYDDDPVYHDSHDYHMGYDPDDYIIDDMGREVPLVHFEAGGSAGSMYWDEDNECWIVL